MELFLQIANLFRDIMAGNIWIATTVYISLGIFLVFLIDLSWKMLTEKASPKWSRATGLVYLIVGVVELLLVLVASLGK
jgi:hypothetical protein